MQNLRAWGYLQLAQDCASVYRSRHQACCSELIGINSQRAQFLCQGLGLSEPPLPLAVSQSQQLLIRNQETVELLTPEGTVGVGQEGSHAPPERVALPAKEPPAGGGGQRGRSRVVGKIFVDTQAGID